MELHSGSESAAATGTMEARPEDIVNGYRFSGSNQIVYCKAEESELRDRPGTDGTVAGKAKRGKRCAAPRSMCAGFALTGTGKSSTARRRTLRRQTTARRAPRCRQNMRARRSASHRTENCKILRDKAGKLCYTFWVFGELPKRFKGAHSKCVRPGDRCVGSNPMLSAKQRAVEKKFSTALFCRSGQAVPGFFRGPVSVSSLGKPGAACYNDGDTSQTIPVRAAQRREDGRYRRDCRNV